MLDDFQKEIKDRRLPARNLRFALIALGISIVKSLIGWFAMNIFISRSMYAHGMVMADIVLFYILTGVSGVFAFLACRGSLRSLKTDKNVRNYIALVIGGLLLIGICKLIFGRFFVL